MFFKFLILEGKYATIFHFSIEIDAKSKYVPRFSTIWPTNFFQKIQIKKRWIKYKNVNQTFFFKISCLYIIFPWIFKFVAHTMDMHANRHPDAQQIEIKS